MAAPRRIAGIRADVRAGPMLAGARVTLKQHRFEIVAAVLAALAVGTYVLVVEYRLRAMNVPSTCISDWLATGPAGRSDCAGRMRAWGSTLALEGERIFSAMAVLPFAVGLLGGVPIVAREVEARTAQTAWSLDGSRRRWLVRQIAPVLVVLGSVVTFAAFAAGAIEADRVAWGQSAFLDLGLHGPLVVARAFGAFGLGLLAGALLGRMLPGLILGGVLCFALVSGLGDVREQWLATQTPTVVGEEQTAVTMGWTWRTPDGARISDAEAMALVPADVSGQDAGQAQAVHSMGWLEDHGYTLLALGVTEEVASGWAPYDALAFSLAGAGSLAATILIVDRRRPA